MRLNSLKSRFRRRRLIVAGIFLLVGIQYLSANDLVQHSPFLPPGWGVKKEAPPAPPPMVAPPVVANQLEFKGVLDLGGVTRFSVFDKRTGKSQWLELNQMHGDMQVVRYDERKNSIMVRSGGRTEEIAMKKADGKSMPIAGAVAPSVTRPTAGQYTPQMQPGNANQRRPGPVVPRRRIIRPSSNTTATPANVPSTSTPTAPPLPTPSS